MAFRMEISLALYNARVLPLRSETDLRAELGRIGVEPSLMRDQLDKGIFRVVRLEHLTARFARFLYQELVLEGGEVALPAHMDDRAMETNVLLLGTRYQFQHLVVRLRTQPDDELQALADDLERALTRADDTG